jgi:uncharacterized protein
MQQLSQQEACRLAISRQRLDNWQRPSPIGPETILDLFRRLGCVQLDPIRHVERTHLLVLWSRLGLFDPADLERLRFTERAVFEYWAHAASLVLTEEWPVYGWMMRRVAARKQEAAWFEEHREAFIAILAEIKEQLQQGPKMSREMELTEGPRHNGRWWSGSYVGRLLQYLWTRGEVMVFGRPFNNHRVWGLAEDFWPDWTPHENWTDEQVTRFATQKAVRALGVATERQIKQHFTRGRYPQLSSVLKTLVKEQLLIPVTVMGPTEALPGPWYLHRDDMALLTEIQAERWQGRTTLLSPFDNLICDRDRTEQLFDFYYRIEIYVPKKKRQYGYYVLPILHHDRLIGRVDAAMDRQANRLHMHNVYAETHAPADAETVKAIAGAAANLAQFLGAGTLVWGNLPEIWSGLQFETSWPTTLQSQQ